MFASTFVGSSLKGKSPYVATRIPGEFTKNAIEETIDDKTHSYGFKFEKVIS